MLTMISNRRWNANDVTKLAECLKTLPPSVKLPMPYSAPSLRLLECVLSLERRYDGFVVPKLDEFREKHPDVLSLDDLDKFVKSCGGRITFFIVELNYADINRAKTFQLVLEYFQKVSKTYEGSDELTRLLNWAQSVQAIDYKKMWSDPKYNFTINVPGFGIAGWQYARMLFGADTCKPDRFVIDYIQDCLGRRVSALTAVELMEAAAPIAGLTVKEADHRIWAYKSRGVKGGKARKCGGRLLKPVGRH